MDKAQNKINKIYKMREKEYKNKIFLITLPEGGEIDEMNVVAFSGFASMGEADPRNPIRFYAKVIGFEDTRAPSRNWGYSLDDFNIVIKPLVKKMRAFLSKIL